MKYLNNILEAVGNTPIVKLNKIGKGLKFNLFAKIEAQNPGGSAKDRIAVAMLDDARMRGKLKEGGTIIEATAGNTGAGLAMAAAQRGYKSIFVVPDKMSDEKINLLKAYGARVIVTKTSVPADSPENYNVMADRLAREIPNSFRVGQFSNFANPLAHYNTTAPEIYSQMDGGIDAFVAGVGTGGTISGIGKYLKERIGGVKIVCADPEGSVLSGGDGKTGWKVEGIGEDFFPDTLNREIIDEYISVSDRESFYWARRLAREEGILAGGSSGTALAAAVKFGAKLKDGANIVVMFVDTGRNYLSKIFSDEWINQNGYGE